MASRLRIGAALLGASVALTLSALPATAEVVVKPDNNASQDGLDVFLKGHKDALDTSLIGLKVIDGDAVKVQAYCVELPTPLKNTLGLKEVPWDQHPNTDSLFRKNPDRNREKVNWILHHSYPEKKPKEIISGLDLDQKEAIAGTQAAVWHFSDGATLDPDRTKNDDVVKLYEYLTGKDNVGLDEQPKPTLKVDPTFKEGKAGEKIGPFTVTTTADQVKVKGKLPKGVTITDKDGKPLEQVSDAELKAAALGDKVTEFFVNVPQDAAAGEAKFALEVNATLEKGRLFVQSEPGNDKKTQSLIVAAPSKVTVDADASAKWVAAPVVTQPSTPSSTPSTTPTTPTTTTTTKPAPAPGGGGNDDDLASTGASIFIPLGIGVGLLGAGAGALFFLRRKKASA